MKKTNVYVIIVIAIIIFAGIIGFTYNKTQNLSNFNQEKKTIKIGVILPLTGGQANLGQSAHKAVLLAQEKLGKTKYNYEIIIEDDALDPKLTSNAANKLVNVDKVDALISFTSGSGNIVAPIATENKILHIGIGTDPAIAKGEYNFLHWTTPDEENRVWINEAMKRNIKKVAFIQTQIPSHPSSFSHQKSSPLPLSHTVLP